jgi:hypothetical protein
MQSLDSTFAELRRRLGDRDLLNPAKSDPLFYFVHESGETLEVRRKLPAWTAALENEGWRIETVSLGKLMWDRIDASGLWDEWIEVEGDLQLEELNEGIREVLRGDDGLLASLRDVLSGEGDNRLLLLTDAALLHPYFRVHFIEAGLTNRIKTPVVLFYPGRRDGQFGLRFLGFYPLDGGYRSTLLGGTA